MLERYLKENWEAYLTQIIEKDSILCQYIAQYLGLSEEKIKTAAAHVILFD